MTDFPPRTRWPLIGLLLALLISLPHAASAGPAGPELDLSSLERASTEPLQVTLDGQTGVPAFLSGRIAAGTTPEELTRDPLGVAQRFLSRHARAFAMRDPRREWRLERAVVDRLGMTHVRLQQVYRGVDVFGAQMWLHFSANARWITAVNGDYLPGLALPSVKPELTAQAAVRLARATLPSPLLWDKPRLVVLDSRLFRTAPGTHLAWAVELYDPSVPARNLILIDAQTGRVLDVLDRLMTDRERRTYTANNGFTLPGTLWLTEAGPVAGQNPDADGLNAHQFAGDTYDYYFATHDRDSFDNAGATLISTVHYGTNFQNAFWNGTQMVYGDGFASANDVVAHELTHAVTERTANLVYRDQSGALNESFSDIFGAMVDRDDWLMGEDLPIGAIRSLENPNAYGDPKHVAEYNATCQDNGGVHTNSGIPNHAAYLLAVDAGREVAERVLYRTLVFYLTPTAQFEDFRLAAIQSATDLFGAGSDEVQATQAALAAVGLDGTQQIPEPTCECPALTTLNDRSLFRDVAFAGRAAATLYRVRDELLRSTPAGQRYTDLYYAHMGRITALLLREPRLRAQAADLLRAVLPGLTALLDGRGDEVTVTPTMVAQLNALLDGLVVADGGGPLAKVIQAERSRIKLEKLAGLTFEEAWRVVSR